jgi:hypothetical protein
MRREVYAKAGPFPTERDVPDFIVWFAQARDAGLTHDILPELLLHRRVHFANQVHDPDTRPSYVRFLKRRLDERRGLTGGV